MRTIAPGLSGAMTGMIDGILNASNENSGYGEKPKNLILGDGGFESILTANDYFRRRRNERDRPSHPERRCGNLRLGG